MRITSLRIENFRSIKALDVELGPTTVFIGPNNAGKTAILDAIRIALTRRWGQRGTGFTEYDVHLAKEGDDPKTSPGVVIELRAEEAVAGEWPDEMQQALDEISQSDPVTGKSSITLGAGVRLYEVGAGTAKLTASVRSALASLSHLLATRTRSVNLES
jgi:putative ATP-dependent endonuclease of OLD family